MFGIAWENVMKLVLYVALLVLCSSGVFSGEKEEVYIVSGAGYKAPVSEVISLYEKETGEKVNGVFGNMKMITTYVKQSGDVSLIIGDTNYIAKSKIKLKKNIKIGDGKLLLVYQAMLNIKNVTDLANDNIKRIGIPDPKKAIYGKAAVELLKAAGIYDKVKAKLIILKTVPQVSSYLKSSNIDVGLINVTDYVKIKNKKLKSIDIDSSMFNEIVIQAGLIQERATGFFNFIKSKKAKVIFNKYGL